MAKIWFSSVVWKRQEDHICKSEYAIFPIGNRVTTTQWTVDDPPPKDAHEYAERTGMPECCIADFKVTEYA